MKLLDNYLQSVRLFLPRNRRDDIAHELREELDAALADLEEELGHPPDHDAQLALLGSHGHPLLVASRYRPQESLIGPLVFPYYRIALSWFLALTAIVSLAGVVPVLIGSAPIDGLTFWLEGLVTDLLMVAGWTTVLGAATDYVLKRRHSLEQWSPSAPTEVTQPDRESPVATSGPEKAIQSAEAISGIVDRAIPAFGRLGGTIVAAVIGIWWVLGVRTPALVSGNAADLVTWGPMVDRMFPLIFSATLLVAWQTCLWLTPSGRAFLNELDGVVSHVGDRRAPGLVVGLAWLGAVVWFWNDWVVWSDAVDAATRTAATIEVAGVGLTLAETLSAVAAALLAVPALLLVRSALRR